MNTTKLNITIPNTHLLISINKTHISIITFIFTNKQLYKLTLFKTLIVTQTCYNKNAYGNARSVM